MPKRILPLTDMQVLKAKPEGKQITLFDGGGMFLLVTPSGGKLWRFKYRYEKKAKLISLGAYPEISLAEARQRKDDARKQLAHGIDPGAVRKAKKQAETEETETFEVIAREWHTKFLHTWTNGHAVKLLSAMTRDLFPWLSARPIKDLKAPELLATLRRIENRGTLETTHRMRGLLGQIFRYAVATGRA